MNNRNIASSYTLKGHNINQYIEAGNLTQEIDLSDDGQLNQILMNSEVYQNINYITKTTVVKKIKKMIKSNEMTLFLNNKYALICYLPLENDFINISFSNLNELKKYVVNKIIKIYGVEGIYTNLQNKKRNFVNNKKRFLNDYYINTNVNTQPDMIDDQVDYLVYELEYGQDTTDYIIMLMINLNWLKTKIASL